MVKIDLGPGSWAFAHVLPRAVFALYDCFDCPEADLERIVGTRVLFRIAVMNSAVTSGRWRVVGHRPPEPELLVPPAFAQRDTLQPTKYFISVGGVERPARREECYGLETLAVWSAEHVEDRLRDYREGRPNKWVESIRIL